MCFYITCEERSYNLTNVWNVQVAVMSACGVWVYNVAMRWKVKVTGRVKCGSTLQLLCRKVRCRQSHTVLQTRVDPADSSLDDGRGETKLDNLISDLGDYQVRWWLRGENIYVAHNIDVGKAIRYVLSGLKQQVMYEVRVFGYSRGGDGLQSHPTLEFVLGETGWHTVLIRSFPRYSVTCTSVRRGFKNQIFRTSTQKTQDGDWLPWKWRLGQESRFNRCQPGLHSCVCDCVLYNLFCSVLYTVSWASDRWNLLDLSIDALFSETSLHWE